MAESNYRNLIVSLEKVARRYPEIMNLLPADGDATVIAARAVFEMLGNLWNTPNSKWLAARNRMCIGLVKDTKTFGNTSVSQGCAIEYFDLHPDEPAVAFLNCGTGGIKYQIYGNNGRGVISVLDEYKPKSGASPQEFLKGGDEVESMLRMAQHRENLKSEIKDSRIPENCPVFAFVTGKIRAAWESGDPETRERLESLVTEFFAADPRIHPCTPGTFFLSQDHEGLLEASGTNSMYNNLTIVGELPKSVRTVAVAGIGRGSVQITWQSVDRSRMYQMNTTPGMDDELGLSTLPWRLMPEIREKIEMIVDFMGNYDQSVIALKSGCMLYLNSPAGKPLLDLLTENVESGSEPANDTIILHQ